MCACRMLERIDMKRRKLLVVRRACRRCRPVEGPVKAWDGALHHSVTIRVRRPSLAQGAASLMHDKVLWQCEARWVTYDSRRESGGHNDRNLAQDRGRFDTVHEADNNGY
jgi:hypothetical protein